jgi:predicted  nucleic acid-binding Zn-ribbon protein
MEKTQNEKNLERELNILQLKYDTLCETLRTVMRRDQDWSIEFKNLKQENEQINKDQEDLYAFIEDETKNLNKMIDTIKKENEELKQKLDKP